MKSAYVFALSVLIMSSGSHAHDEASVLEGPYIGQTPPGLTPEVFAPSIFLQSIEIGVVASHPT
ncbi:hypothetical protein GCM10007978_04240 [Shewanella hanedai]|uniref:Uncharacterized protein n=1 Tax=Shewanella hanedai TaxID=25 RepID=A0A553JTZ1_SHEHA|nr:hypothetical protein [Shewanella hanedai]TRY15911.1 hypothetical protein FN961_02735 [Shewanella hanedai]GGI69525.1 hypothetical protein GCM10007978_04240 [Shewanella hanedai]